MDNTFDNWKKLLEDFKQGVTKDLEEIRQYKDEVRQIKADIDMSVGQGYVLRDPKRIVISAPEVIIGDVDRDGTLNPNSGSRVVIRGQRLNLEGVGDAGTVHTRAASIRQTAVNPGIDGEENVVGPLSEVVSQASQIAIEANSSHGVFPQAPRSAGLGGVKIHADSRLALDASLSSKNRKQALEDRISALQKEKSDVSDQISDAIKSYEGIAKSLKKIYDTNADIVNDEMSVRTNVPTLIDSALQFQQLSQSLYDSFNTCAQWLSRLAEINRQITCLKDQKSAVKSGGDYTDKSTGAGVQIVGEHVGIQSVDGDGNIRKNEGAGLSILANNVKVEAIDEKGELQKEGKIFLNAMSMELSTATAKDLKYDDKGKLQSGEYLASGDILVRSKTMEIESLDMEVKDGEIKEKALTKDGALSIRTEKTDIQATDTEGKASGSIGLNAKELDIRSMNVDKEKRTDDKLAEGSTMLLLSEKMYLGAKKKDIKSKKVQVVTEEAGMFADKTLELQQGEAKGVLQLADGKAALSGSDTQIFGNTTLNGKTEAKDEFKAPKATIEHVEAKTSFKSQNISDGIPVPPPPSTAKLSAKLKEEDVPEKK